MRPGLGNLESDDILAKDRPENRPLALKPLVTFDVTDNSNYDRGWK